MQAILIRHDDVHPSVAAKLCPIIATTTFKIDKTIHMVIVTNNIFFIADVFGCRFQVGQR